MAKGKTEEEIFALHVGVSVTTLAKLFGLDSRKVTSMISGIEPNGKLLNYPVYHIAHVAPRLVGPDDEQVMRLLKEMPPGKLPAKLSETYWKGRLARQSFEEKAGETWSTDEVITAITEVLKVARSSITLFTATVNREVGLSSEQKQLLESLSDSLMSDMATALSDNETFSKIDNNLGKYYAEEL